MNTAVTDTRDTAWPGGVSFSRVGDPSREIWAGSALALVLIVGLIGWGGFVRMDAAAYGQGVVVVSGHRQTVEAAAPGFVSAIYAHDGDKVTAGQVLVSLAPVDARNDRQGLLQHMISLWAERARLDAEQSGQRTVRSPQEFQTLGPADLQIAVQQLAFEQNALNASMAARWAQNASLRDRVAQSQSQITGFKAQIDANGRQRLLTEEELAAVRDLAARGYAPQNRVRSLEQNIASLDGQTGAQSASIGQMQAASGEARMQIHQADAERAQLLADERRRLEAAIQDVVPKFQAATERLGRTDIRAPVSGTVLGMTTNTLGSAIGIGQTLLELVPDKHELVVEARVAPKDIVGARIGAKAKIRLPSTADGASDVIDGVVERISADAITDPRTGEAYVNIEVKFTAAADAASARYELRPGSPVSVIIPLHERTALQYWFDPLMQGMWRSMHER
jgi:HlyD family secretion protein